jgi:hypothetical protein
MGKAAGKDIKVMDKYEYIRLAEQNKEPKEAIINLDEPKNEGTHWVAFKTDKYNIIHYYDSFGIFPPISIKKRLVMYNTRIDQKDKESNCGYRALNYLIN